MISKTLGNITAFCVMTMALGAVPANAAMTIDSSAYALSATLSAVGGVGLVNIGPVAASGGSAPGAYADSASLASLDQNLQLGGFGLLNVRQRISTGVLQSSASSPYPATPTGTASAGIADVDFGLTTQALFLPPLTVLGLSADAIMSTTTVSAENGLSAFGSTTIAGLDLSGLGLGGLLFNGSLFVNPDPDTVLLNLLGLKIVLNEQIWSGDGVTDLGLTTNALRFSFDDFLLGGRLVSGDIILGQSSASIQGYEILPPVNAVPEPASWAMMIAGFGLVGGAMRRRHPHPAMA